MTRTLLLLITMATLIAGSCASSTSTFNKKGTMLKNGSNSEHTQQNY